MAIERLKPIVDANGDPYYVVERDYIGAEHANAQAKWTRTAHSVLRRQHRADGIHDHLPIPRAVICGWFGFHSGSADIFIDPRSTVMGFVQAAGPDDPRPNAYTSGTLISATRVGRGELDFTFAIPLPTSQYGLINFTPGMESGGTIGGGPPVPRNVYIIPASQVANGLKIYRDEGPGPSLQDGQFCFALVC